MHSTLTVYKASAGSGKTFTLAVEYIALLLSSVSNTEFHHTLAVTFTNKATAEMKDRILQQLYALAHNLPEGQVYYEAVQKRLCAYGVELTENQIRRKAGKVLSGILHDFNYFRVETIDSFFQSILRHLAHELSLTANLEVELNTEEVISHAVDRIIDTLQYNPAIQQWVLNYVAERIENNEKWDVTRSVKSFARCIFEESFQNRNARQRELLNNEQVIRGFQKRMKDIEVDAEQAIIKEAETLDELLQKGVLNYERISRGNNYHSALQSIMSLAYDQSKATLPSAAADPLKLLKSTDKKNEALLAEAEVISGKIGHLLKTYQDNISQIKSARLARKHINPLRLLGCIEEMADQICKEKNQFLLNRTPILLSKLVEDSDAPFVFEKMGTQLHHVMIDEFQDTSLLQWQNFKTLLLENQATGGHDLVVGDVKQSIYRWRNGDWSVLHGIEDEMRFMRPDIVPLDTNYRSQEKIIDFNNTFFPKAADLLDSLSLDARFQIKDIYADVAQKCKKDGGKGYVSVRIYEKNGINRPDNYEERFIRDMIEQIRGLMDKGVALSDMAILVRRRNMGTELIDWFHRLAPDIRLVSDESFLLSASVAVQMIVNALRVLADPQDTDPVPLHYLIKHYLTDVSGCPAMPHHFTAKDAGQCLPDEFLKDKAELSTLPLYVLCEKLYAIFNLSRIPGQSAYLFAFFDQLQNYLRNHPSDLRSFLSAWDEKLANEPIPCGKIPGLQIMTIHQSKGLQFHTVLLPYTDWDIEKDKRGDLLWCEAPEVPYNELGLLPVSAGSDIRQSIFAPWYEEEHLQKRVDALNMMYVAFTRAECNMMIWGMTSKTDKLSPSSMSGDLLRHGLELEKNGDEYIYVSGGLMGKEIKERARENNRMTPFAQDLKTEYATFRPHLDFMQSNESSQFILTAGEEGMEGQDYIELGKILHYVLSQISHIDDVDTVLDRCQNQGLISNPSQRKSIIKRIQQGMQQELVRSWFSPDNEVYNECSIVATNPMSGEPEVRRPDRVVFSGNDITVIDFKCGKPWPEHVQQVCAYMELMSRMYPNMKIKGYVWYIYSGRIKHVNLPSQMDLFLT